MRSVNFAVILLLLLFASDVHAYVGPGLGLGVIGAVVGVIISIFLAIIGFIWYPIRRIMKKRKEKIDDIEKEVSG